MVNSPNGIVMQGGAIHYPASSTAPTGNITTGSTYYNTVTNTFNRWDGTSWVVIFTNNDASTRGAFTTAPTTNNVVGDNYYNTTDNTFYRWDGTSWVVVLTNNNSQMLGNFTTAPTANTVGDQYFNTTNQTNYYWDGTSWVAIFTAGAGGSADGNYVGSGATLPPVGTTPDGSLFYNTSNDGTGGWYATVGGVWVQISPQDQDWKRTTTGNPYPHSTSNFTEPVLHNGQVQVGVNVDSTTVSLAVGTGNTTSGVNSVATGTSNTANGLNSIAVGTLQDVQADNVFAFGRTARTYSQANVVGISGCRLSIDESNPTAPLHYRTIPIASTDAIAGTFGHTVGAIYMTSTGVVRCKL